MRSEIATYLLSRVRMVDDCWEWTGTRRNGKWNYGLAQIHGKTWRAHRLSYILHIGPIPERMQVCHHCDNPPCINPAHLFLGTNADNVHDCMRKGRDRKGDRRGERTAKKLTLDDAVYIIISKARGIDLARELGITKTTVGDIRKGRCWTEAREIVETELGRPAQHTKAIMGDAR